MHALILALNESEISSTHVVESLELSGHNVHVVKSFRKAIDFLRDKHVDLIVSDVHLENGGNVFDFLRWVKDNPSTRGTLFVLFSLEPTPRAKLFEDGIKTTARLLGAVKYISMECFDSEEFRNQIDALLRSRDQLDTSSSRGGTE